MIVTLPTSSTTIPILSTRRTVICAACESEFTVQHQDGRPMHDCPKLGGISVPLSPLYKPTT